MIVLEPVPEKAQLRRADESTLARILVVAELVAEFGRHAPQVQRWSTLAELIAVEAKWRGTSADRLRLLARHPTQQERVERLSAQELNIPAQRLRELLAQRNPNRRLQ